MLLDSLVEAELVGGSAPIAARLAERLGQDPAQVSRTLSELKVQQLVELDDETGGYRVGPAYFRYARSTNGAELPLLARWQLRRLVVEFGCPAWISVPVHTSALSVASERSNGFEYVAAAQGRRVPLWCTGAGRALLLEHSALELGALFGAVALSNGGPRAAHDLKELFERTQIDRERGFVLAVEEFEHGTTEISAPIAAPGGSILASVSVALASTASEDHQRVVRMLLNMASELAEQLSEQTEDDDEK